MSTRPCNACGEEIIFARRRPVDRDHPWEALNAVEIPDAGKDPDDRSQRLLMEDGTSWPPKEAVKHYAQPDRRTEAEDMNVALEYPWYTVHRCRRGTR